MCQATVAAFICVVCHRFCTHQLNIHFFSYLLSFPPPPRLDTPPSIIWVLIHIPADSAWCTLSSLTHPRRAIQTRPSVWLWPPGDHFADPATGPSPPRPPPDSAPWRELLSPPQALRSFPSLHPSPCRVQLPRHLQQDLQTVHLFQLNSTIFWGFFQQIVRDFFKFRVTFTNSDSSQTNHESVTMVSLIECVMSCVTCVFCHSRMT